MVADAPFLAPDRLPSLVELVEIRVHDLETFVEHIRGLHVRFQDLAAVILQAGVFHGAAKLESERTGQHHLGIRTVEFIDRRALGIEVNPRVEHLIGRGQHEDIRGSDMRDLLHRFRCIATGQNSRTQGYQQYGSFHIQSVRIQLSIPVGALQELRSRNRPSPPSSRPCRLKAFLAM